MQTSGHVDASHAASAKSLNATYRGNRNSERLKKTGDIRSFDSPGSPLRPLVVGGRTVVGASVFGLGCTLAAPAPGYWWFAAALIVIGAAALTFTNGTNSIMQLSTEPAMRGGVMALRVAIALGGTPIGAPIAGWVANQFGPRWALGIGEQLA